MARFETTTAAVAAVAVVVVVVAVAVVVAVVFFSKRLEMSLAVSARASPTRISSSATSTLT